jgi:mRNA interferase MazF
VEPLAAGTVVLVPFPFSDLSQAKLRPAVVLAAAAHDDFILCQITSNPYSDPLAIRIDDGSFAEGSLSRISFVRPGKLFTAHHSLVRAQVGRLRKEALEQILRAVKGMFGAPGD